MVNNPISATNCPTMRRVCLQGNLHKISTDLRLCKSIKIMIVSVRQDMKYFLNIFLKVEDDRTCCTTKLVN